jgi:hypothetical protein
MRRRPDLLNLLKKSCPSPGKRADKTAAIKCRFTFGRDGNRSSVEGRVGM